MFVSKFSEKYLESALGKRVFNGRVNSSFCLLFMCFLSLCAATEFSVKLIFGDHVYFDVVEEPRKKEKGIAVISAQPSFRRQRTCELETARLHRPLETLGTLQCDDFFFILMTNIFLHIWDFKICVNEKDPFFHGIISLIPL